MRKIITGSVFCLLALMPKLVPAQVPGLKFIEAPYVKVYTPNNVEKKLAWSGGVNAPQFAQADLNNDGVKDLVIFEAYLSRATTYINKGTAGSPDYRYEPKYARNFPKNILGYLILADYNCDNIPDLFHRGFAGVAILKGYYNAQDELCFTFYRDLFYQSPSFGWINAYVEPGDIPAIVDVDNDGDLDLLAYEISGGQINFYKNLRVENGWHCDSFSVQVQDGCWGKILQYYHRALELKYSCTTMPKPIGNETPVNVTLPESPEQTTHTGNTICLVDYDHDGDYDLWNGNVSFNDILFAKNGRVNGRDSMVAQDSIWKDKNGHTVSLDIWVAAFNLDIDDDGKKDFIFSPHTDGGAENYKSVHFYKNVGSSSLDEFEYQSDTFLVEQMIDHGSESYPVFYDYNKDGKPDLFVSSDGIYIGGGLMESKLAYYENTSSSGQAAFTLRDLDFMGMSFSNFGGFSVAIGDLNNDGLDDMVVGRNDGTLSFYKNIASNNNVQPVWQFQYTSMKDTANNDINVGLRPRPFIADINNDGKPDLLIGKWNGVVAYYENKGGTPGNLQLAKRSDKLGDMESNLPSTQFPNLAFVYYGKINNGAQKYFMLGGSGGYLRVYQASTNLSQPFTLLDTMYSNIAVLGSSTPTFADINNDGAWEMISGTHCGGLQLFVQSNANNIEGVHTTYSSFKLYPNPAQGAVWVSLEDDIRSGYLVLRDITGRQIASQAVDGNSGLIEWNVGMLSNGIYFVTLKTEQENKTEKLIVSH